MPEITLELTVEIHDLYHEQLMELDQELDEDALDALATQLEGVTDADGLTPQIETMIHEGFQQVRQATDE